MQNKGRDGRISEAVVRRLPRYLRFFKACVARGIEKISSERIAEYMETTASQVRQDFNRYGGFGQQRYGYDTARMKEELTRILGLDRTHRIIIIGAGNIGRALANYKDFQNSGFYVEALFDIDVREERIGDIPVYGMDKLKEFLEANRIDIAVIAVRKDAAESVLDGLTELGVKSFWNFSSVELKGTDGVLIENVGMSDSLFYLSYRINRPIIEG